MVSEEAALSPSVMAALLRAHEYVGRRVYLGEQAPHRHGEHAKKRNECEHKEEGEDNRHQETCDPEQ